MIAYVESNFVLEIVLGQEHAASVEALLVAAEQGAIEMVIPGFAVAEPFSTITNRERNRDQLVKGISATLRDLQRSSPYQNEALLVASAVNGLASITGREITSLHDITKRLLTIARTVELDAACFALALAYQQQYALSPQDSIIYASIISDLRMRPLADAKCFITRNSRDFDDPGIVTELNSLSCRLFFSIEDGSQYSVP